MRLANKINYCDEAPWKDDILFLNISKNYKLRQHATIGEVNSIDESG